MHIPLLETWFKDIPVSKRQIRSSGTPASLSTLPQTSDQEQTQNFHNAGNRRLWKTPNQNVTL
jgi:hypothetical protein